MTDLKQTILKIVIVISMITSFLVGISAPANAAAGTITSGACSSAVGETLTATSLS